MSKAAKAKWISGVTDELTEFWETEFPEEDTSSVSIFTGLAFLSRQLQNFHDQTLKPYGRVLTEYQTLAHLRMVGSASPTELNQLLMQTPAGMTYTIDQLEKAKLVSRCASKTDRRSIRVTLTAAGKREAERLMKAEIAAQLGVTERFGAAENSRCLKAIMHLVDAFATQDESTKESAVAPLAKPRNRR